MFGKLPPAGPGDTAHGRPSRGPDRRSAVLELHVNKQDVVDKCVVEM